MCKYDCALVQLNFRLFYYALVLIYFNKISSSSASVTTSNQNDFVTMSILEKLLDWQDKAYRSATMVIIEDIRSEMKGIRREMNELRESVNFMSSKYDNMKKSVEATDMKIKAVYVQMEGMNNDINRNFEAPENKVEYLENQSRRNNIKIFCVPEEENEKTWDDTEVIVKTLIRNKLGIEEHIEIERAHRLARDDRGEDETHPQKKCPPC